MVTALWQFVSLGIHLHMTTSIYFLNQWWISSLMQWHWLEFQCSIGRKIVAWHYYHVKFQLYLKTISYLLLIAAILGKYMSWHFENDTCLYDVSHTYWLARGHNVALLRITVLERKFVTKIRVRYHDPRGRRQQSVRMFTLRFLLFRIVFHVFDAGYRAIVRYCFYVIPESVIEFDKTVVNWCTKNTEDLGNSSVQSW